MFYIYAYLRKGNLTPYYIGKGKGRRAWQKKHSCIVPSDKSRIVIMEDNLTELGAFALERFYIRWYGRKDLGTGILHNKTDGGEGPAGCLHTEETKEKLSLIHRGKKFSDKTKKRMSDNHSKYWKGREVPQEMREKISKAQSRGNHYSAIPVSVNGISYSCKKDAYLSLGINKYQLEKLLSSDLG